MNLEELKKYCKNNITTKVIKNEDNISEYIFMCKNGSKIHIKKKNKGKFSDYCGGKVTEECIQRGKNSSDPGVRKMATFAKNSRGWSKKK